ncbi:DUF4157 domain-containing protein [Deinococcus oregonensis]|uniref:DUF4157 domain-containing protein n=1 Tax=Deinococcus oregonensis TaxID=1805970 RepID=A0ABV6AWS5_9DEIO
MAADLSRFTSLPVKAQRQAVQPLLQAASVRRAEEQRLTGEQLSVQRQLAALPQASLTSHAAVAVPARPVTAGDWVTVMRHQAEQINGQRLSSREHDGFLALQRQVTQTLVQGFRQDRQAPDARYAQYGEHLATLQRHPNSASVSRVVLGFIPQRERLPLQRAVDQALQRQVEQEAQGQAAVQRQTLQRKKAELDEESLQPVMQRIAARRGAGNPLPAAIQRHLEQGLNHDLSQVRIHDDAEADKLSRKVNALAFTTGSDIFFQSGQFNPNTQSGLELLAHEVTHTVQQSKGQVGTGIDPDAGLESEARKMGRKLSARRASRQAWSVRPATRQVSGGLSLQRQYHTPFVLMNSQTKTTFSLGGQGKGWADANSAVQLALQMTPGRLKQQFKGMPEALGQGLLIMVRDIALTLGISTAVGAVIGAFFSGVGAVPGATIGFEVGNLVLTAWGLGAVVVTLKNQFNSLGQSIRQFTILSKAANGNAQTIKQAADALTNGILIVCTGLVLAVGALLIKNGAPWLIKSKLGTAIGAESSASPSLMWLKQRQQLTATRSTVSALIERGRAVGRARLNREAALLSRGLKMASGTVKGIDPPGDPALLAQAVKVGTLKYQLHPGFAAVKAELARYGFEIREASATHVVYQRILDPKNKRVILSIQKFINLEPNVRFLDLLHELDHVRQLMLNLKGEMFTETGLMRPNTADIKSFSNDPLYRKSTLTLPQNTITEIHVRLKEYLRLKAAGADAALLAEHYEGLAQWSMAFREAISSARGSSAPKLLEDWAYSQFPDLPLLIDEFQSLPPLDGQRIHLR